MSKTITHTVFKKSHNFAEAEEWDIQQQLAMTPYERQLVARILKERYYGKNVPDIREEQRE